MWPKALAQLLELLPHISRLVPVADRFLQGKAAGDDTTRQALEHKLDDLAATLRTSIANSTGTANGSLIRQLQEQTEALGLIAADVRAMRKAMDFQDARLLKLEQGGRTLKTLVVLATIQTAVVAALLVIGLLGWHLHL